MKPTPYDRDILRAQLQILRQSAAERAALEEEIRTEYERVMAAAEEERRTVAEATERQYAAELEATKKEYAASLERSDALAAAERKRLEEQRTQAEAQIQRQIRGQEAKLSQDEQFEQSSFRAIAKEKKQGPQRLFQTSEKELAKLAATIDECEAHGGSFAAACGVATAAPTDAAPPAPADGEFPTGVEVLKMLEDLTARIANTTNSLCGTPSASRIFGSGAAVAAISVPLIFGTMAAAAAAFGEIGRAHV